MLIGWAQNWPKPIFADSLRFRDQKGSFQIAFWPFDIHPPFPNPFRLQLTPPPQLCTIVPFPSDFVPFQKCLPSPPHSLPLFCPHLAHPSGANESLPLPFPTKNGPLNRREKWRKEMSFLPRPFVPSNVSSTSNSNLRSAKVCFTLFIGRRGRRRKRQSDHRIGGSKKEIEEGIYG